MKVLTISLIGVILLLGCSSSRITHSWKKENLVHKNYKKILVLSLNNDKDARYQEKMENHLVGDLTTLGYEAVSSLKEFGPIAFRNTEEATAISKLQNSGFDAVITIVLLDKSREKYYIPNRIQFSPYAMYQIRFGGYYTTIYDRIYSPGYYSVDTRYFWESNFYDVESKELVYSVQTEAFDPSSAESLGHEYGKKIVKDMEKNKILVKSQVLSSTNK